MVRPVRRGKVPVMNRRAFLLGSAVGIALLAAGPRAWAQAGGPAAATDFIVQLGNELEAVVNAPDSTGGKKQRMQPLVEQAVAIDQIGQFTLGQYWRTASPAQRQRFLQLFHQVLINNITGRLGEFRGLTFRTTQTVERNGNFLVGTLITRPNQQPNNVQWVVNGESGRLQIVDVIAEGTSLRQTQRSDYGSFISRNGGLDALLNAMQRQAGT